jgi:hemerythrin-like domain-containing protein
MKSVDDRSEQRRLFVQTALSAVGVALVGCAGAAGRGAGAASPKGEAEEEAEVTPGEDLMQEHAVLERVLLVYDEASRRIEDKTPFDPALLTSAAGIIRRFVEDYHEKQEEEFVFPRLQKAGREVELVGILLHQHQRGRQLTDDIVRRVQAGVTPELVPLLRSFVRMYRPHAAREGSVLFPAFREVVGREGYEDLGEQFEDREHQLFGAHGFEDTVAEVARIETALGIADLAQFTAPAAPRSP